MHHNKESKKKPNPKNKSNILSLITFFFTREFLIKGFKRDITEDDIYEVLPQFKASKIGDKLEEEWLKESQKNNPSIYRLLWSCYGRYYFLLGLPQLSSKIITILVLPQTLGKFISYFTKNTKLTTDDAVYYALIFIGLKIINCTYDHNYRFWIIELGIKMKIAFSSLIYRKSMNLKSLSKSGAGKIVTLITKDVNSLENIITFLNDMWISVIVIVLAIYVMYARVGTTVFIGLFLLLLMVPFQICLGKLTSNLRIKAAKATDCRLQVTQEALSYIKIIKMYTWENIFINKISKARDKEIRKIKLFYLARATFTEIGTFAIALTLYIIIITSYTKLDSKSTAETVIFVQIVLGTLRSPITISIPLGILRSAELVASVKRIKEVLTEKEQEKIVRDNNSNPSIQIERGSILTSGHLILDDINFEIKSGLNLISGGLGSGKSSLLKVLLGEYLLHQGQATVTGTISYSSEDPWLFPASIKQNILFGEKYNKDRYHKVLKVCALDFDIGTFKKGDATVIDDRGRNLSKGQQMRINLARAVYRNSDIYLIDDCLSSLDMHLQNFVYVECIKNFLKDKIVVMVTQNERLFSRADNILLLEGGTVKSFQPSEMPEQDIGNLQTHDPLERDEDFYDRQVENEESFSRNIYDENPKKGKVDLQCYKNYCRFGGGLLILIGIFVVYVATQAGFAYAHKLVSKWVNIQQSISEYSFNSTNNADQDSLGNLSNYSTNTIKYHDLLQDHKKTLNFYTTALIASTFFIIFRIYSYFSFAAKASLGLHKLMTFSVVNATMKFFDARYFGNILNRFSKDMYNIDEILPFNVNEFFKFFCNLGSIVFLIVSVNRSFIPVFLIFFCILFLIRRFYIPTGRSLQRLDSASRSPVIGHLNATLDGLSTIRAYNAQEILKQEFDRHQDLYSSAIYMEQSGSRAFAYSLDMMCQLFITVLIIRYLISEKDTLAGDVGLVIYQALGLSGSLQWGVRQWTDIETQMTSVERVLEYSNTEIENKNGQLIESLGSSGKISYKNVNLVYASSKDYVLKNINFVANPGEKIGIVGRTGAGKSSLISILFRLYKYEGTISINDIDVETLSLDFLRSCIGIIPQDPVVFTGTIRRNIDPTELHKDEEIWNALNRANLTELISNLDQQILDNGSNFSAGQKQLICLARALISKHKIIILDEANANVDAQADAVIEKIIEEHFQECTVLIVAHKLQTVLSCDKVMVIDQGEIVEYDKPSVLMENETGVFYKMVQKAGLIKKNS